MDKGAASGQISEPTFNDTKGTMIIDSGELWSWICTHSEGAALSSKARSAQSREVVVKREQDRALKMEPQPISQLQVKLVGSWVGQQDDDDEDHSLGQVEVAT